MNARRKSDTGLSSIPPFQGNYFARRNRKVGRRVALKPRGTGAFPASSTGHSVMRYVRGAGADRAARSSWRARPDLLAVASTLVTTVLLSCRHSRGAFRDQFGLTPEQFATLVPLCNIELVYPIKMTRPLATSTDAPFENGKPFLFPFGGASPCE